MFFTHDPIINKLLLAASLFFVLTLAYARRRRIIALSDDRIVFLVSLVCAGWIAFGQQVVTGREIWPGHFVQYTIPIVYVVTLTLLALVWRRTFSGAYRSLILAFSLSALLWGSASVVSVTHALPDFRSSQRDAALFGWLDANAGKECVILIKEYDERLERAIPAYTDCDTYSTTYAFSGVPKERILHNLFLRMRLLDVPASDAKGYMYAHESMVRGYFFDDWNQMFGSGHDPWLTALVDRLDREYSLFAKEDLKAQVLAYRMDYLVTESPIPTNVIRELPGLTLVASLPDFGIYAFR
jgi:hypothetical protein